jgi:hypothetical protein
VIRRDALLNELYHLCLDAGCEEKFAAVLAEVLAFYEHRAPTPTPAEATWVNRRLAELGSGCWVCVVGQTGICGLHRRLYVELFFPPALKTPRPDPRAGHPEIHQ